MGETATGDGQVSFPSLPIAHNQLTRVPVPNLSFFNKGGPNNKKPNMPDRPLPPGYVCFRCTQKGHWIYDCPTNDDPNFDAKHRIKRTTGIPRSFMKRVDKADIPAGDQADDSRPNKGFMIDADGNRVMVMPDTASWEKFEARHKASAAKKQEDEKVDQELQELGFDCPIDHRLFVVPTKTPCCSKTYCHGCIEDALVNNDLACPNCGTENVLIDDLLPDTEIALKIKAWQDEKVAEAKAKEVAAAAAAAEKRADDIAADKVVESIETSAEDEHKEDSTDKKEKKDESAQSPKIEIELVDNRDASVKPTKSPSPAISTTSANSKARGSSTGSTSKKRPAEQDLKNDRIPTAPAAMRKQAEQNKSVDDIDAKFLEDMQKLSQGQLTQGVAPMGFPNPMAFPAQNGMMGMPNMMGMPIMTSMPMNMPNAMAMGNMNPMMGMPNMMGMPGMQNPMAMQANGWAGMGTGAQMGFQQQNGNYGTQYNNQGWQNPQQQWNNNNNQLGQQPGAYGQAGNFAGNQNGNNFQAGFNAQQAHGSDSPYFRQPVNPFRHQKQKRMRPSDYREL